MALLGTRGPLLGNLIKAETLMEHGFCRQKVSITKASETKVSVGSIFAQVTADGSYTFRDPAAADGSEVAVGIAIENKTIPAGVETELTLLVRGPAIVGRDALVYDISHTDTQKATTESELEALNILVKEQI